ncbi:hypothetical protein A0256_11880 [Mucilaginibacter sp. PAMC 26640]|nr:hypothetical protein A0256_11880 [Mucilaginibacter sp. PAMC 26640]
MTAYNYINEHTIQLYLTINYKCRENGLLNYKVYRTKNKASSKNHGRHSFVYGLSFLSALAAKNPVAFMIALAP